MTLSEYKDELSQMIEAHLQSDKAHTLTQWNLQTLQKKMCQQDTLSDLLYLLFHEADLLHEQIGTDWIEELAQLATPEQLVQERILINPTEIKEIDPENRHVVLLTRPQEITQFVGEVLYIGTCDIELHGGTALVQGNSQVQSHGTSKVTATDHAIVTAMDNTMVYLYGCSSCKAYDEAQVEAHMHSGVIAMGSNKVRVTDQASGIAYTGNQLWELCDHSQLLIPASYPSKEKLMVKMDGSSHLFNCADKVALALQQTHGHTGAVVPCQSTVIQEALLTLFLSDAKSTFPVYNLLEPLPIEESKERLRTELPADITPEEKAQFEGATSEQALCSAVELIMRQHLGHGITGQTLASTITKPTLDANHIILYGNYPNKPEQGHHYHFFGHGVFCPVYGDNNTYHMNGHSIAISHYNTPIIASQDALLLQIGDKRTNRLYGQSKGLLFNKGVLSAHDHSQVYVGDHATVHAHDHVHAEIGDQGKAYLYRYATAVCRGESEVVAKGESRVVGDDQARIDLYDQSQGAALKNSTVSVNIHTKGAIGTMIENEGSIASFLYAKPINEKKVQFEDNHKQTPTWKPRH